MTRVPTPNTDSYDTDPNGARLLWIAEVIRSHGIAVMAIGTGECSVPGCDCSEPEPVPWSYTIGFYERGHPEIIAFGLSLNRSVTLMNWVRSREVRGIPVAAGKTILLDGRWVRFDAVPVDWMRNEQVQPMGKWCLHYGIGRGQLDPPSLLQLVWSDADGRFPDDPGCDPDFVHRQPVGSRLLGDWWR